MRASLAPRPTSAARPASCRRRGSPATASSASCSLRFCQTSCRSWWRKAPRSWSRANGGSRSFLAPRSWSRCSASTCSATGCATSSIRNGAPEAAMTEAVPLLDVADLTVEFSTRRGVVRAVEHVDVRVGKGETVGIVGESGSGKSVTSYAVMRILDRAGRIVEGAVHFTGLDLTAATEDQMRNLRGREISMIFQNPRAALNPIRKVGDQIEDVLRQHVQTTANDRGEKAIEALEQVKIARPRERYHAYPFELSGGMCQRVVIALALACNPQLLIADEPTTGLDVTTQKAVMDLIVELTKRRSMSTILITHDLGLAAAYCDRVVVMEKGRVVETARSADIFANPEHAYTKKLMRATPRIGVSLRDLLPEEEAAALPTVTATAAAPV